jgi:cytochrome c oxidase assembly protein subunit 15
VSKFTPGPRAFLVLCRLSLATIILNVATGAAVRLSGSGLGCPDWPTCSHRQLTPAVSLHPDIEFGNRMVVTLLVVCCAMTWVASLLRRPGRRDLRWLSGGLLLGILGEAVLGAVVVYSKLNAYVVMTHFMVGIALLAVAVELCLRATHGPGRGTPVVSRRVLGLTRAYLVLLTCALVAGTATTGAGPHAGGKGAKRVPIGLSDMTRIHAETVWVTAGRFLLGAMIVQGLIGYTQYFTKLPAVLVGFHVVGATIVVTVALWFHHGLSDHRPEVVESVDDDPAGSEAGSVSRGADHLPVPEPEPEPEPA